MDNNVTCLFVSEGFGIGCTLCTVERRQSRRLHWGSSYSGSAGKQHHHLGGEVTFNEDFFVLRTK